MLSTMGPVNMRNVHVDDQYPAELRSHSWGTSFSHFVRSIRCHALSKEGPTSWIDAAYWICSFATGN